MKRSWIAALAVLLLAGPSRGDTPTKASRILVAGRTAQLVGVGQAQRLRLTFADEFNSFDRQRGGKGFWRTAYWFASPETFGGRTMPHQKEEQLYVDPDFAGAGDKPLGLNPFTIRGGVLDITADRTRPEHLKALYGYKYTSGLITTKDVFEQAYGYFEIRAKLPKGQGFWPGFWLAPADRSWPPEIDVVEVLGQSPDKIYVTVHYPDKGKHERFGLELRVEDVSADFHVYGMAWTPEMIRFYVDRREVASTPTPATVNKPMYVLANLGVGGNWGGPADDTTPLPAVMSIDYIRIYQFVPQPKPPPPPP